MEDRRIVKATRRISLLLADKSTLDGMIFLSQYSDHNSAPESVGDLLNRKSFLPVNGPDGITLVNIEGIILATTLRREELDENTEAMGVRYSVKIQIMDSSTVTGELLVELPEESCRVKDYLNLPDRFFRLIHGDKVIYINRHFILTVTD